MEKKHIISLGGELASGKGSVSKVLMKRLNYGVYKNGDYFRKLARESGMDIENSAAEYAKTHDNFIIDARLGWYAVPQSFKVYLKVDINVAAKRALNDEQRKSSENFNTLEEQKQDLIKRYTLENERYWNLYGVRKEDESNYDLVIDTTNQTPEDTADIIEKEYKKWLEE